MRNLPGGEKECESLPYRIRDVALNVWLVIGEIDVRLAGRVLVDFGLLCSLSWPEIVRAPPGFEVRRRR